jgi:hypothetical protein
MKETKRLDVMRLISEGKISMSSAAEVLGVSKRQACRIKKSITERGIKGAVHGNRGRVSNRKLSEAAIYTNCFTPPSAMFVDTETTHAYFDVPEKTFKTKGLSHSLYVEKHSIFRPARELSIEEQLAGKQKPMTQLGRALDELGITLILANPPQAKGRIERRWDTFSGSAGK